MKQLTLKKKMALELTAGADQVNAEKKPNQARMSNNMATSQKDSMLHRNGIQQVSSEDESHPGLFHQ